MTDLTLPDTEQKPDLPDAGPPTEVDGMTATTETPDFGDRFAAAWRQRTLETDAWGYTQRLEAQAQNDIYDALPPEAKDRMDTEFNRLHGTAGVNLDRHALYREKLLQEVRAIKELGPAGDPALAKMPATEDEFQAQITAERKDQYREASDLIAVDGPGVGGFLGGLSRDLVDPINLALAPVGVQGGILRTFAAESVLGGVAAGLNLPREYAVADELDLPKPDALTRIGTEALASGVLGAGFVAILRGAQAYKVRRRVRKDGKPEGMPQTMHDEAVAEAETILRDELDGEPARDRRTREGEQDGPAVPDFDFSLTGNASPRTNRAGYIFGRLLERGLSPHIAAGWLGNAMVESGTALNPRAVGDGGNAFGLWQWNGPRRHALNRFAQSQGKDPADIDTQIDFLFHELHTSEASAWARIRQAGTAEEAAQLISDLFERPGIPHLNRRIGHARAVVDQYEGGAVPRGGTVAPTDYVPVNTTTRAGYTQTGQVRTAAGTRVDVEYQVIDRASLQRASGDLQPRDRALGNSDEQVANIAATLDPVLLMPAPTADRGAPIVGPDNIVESGNGRFAAIERAYERHPDRADAYRQQIEAAGFDIPDDVRDPVLVARRTSQMGDDARRSFVVEAQDSGVARMTAVERARAEAAMLDAGTLSRLDPTVPLTDPGNGDFIRAALDRLPRTERNAFTTPEGRLNADGRKALERALFARAYEDAELLRRFTEQDAAELRSLLDALFEAAPGWARLTGEVADGQVKPEFDITGHVTEAMRIIATARRMANADGIKTGHVLAELLDEIDLIEGAVAPLTRALVGMFWKDGKAAPKARIAGFLDRYAGEARKVGRTDAGLFDQAPTVPDVLRTLDAEGFAELGDDLGRPRGQSRQPEPDVRGTVPEGAYADGAMSEDAIEAARTAEDELREAIERGAASRAVTREAQLADGDFEVPLGNGETVMASEMLDDLDADDVLDTVVSACIARGADA